MTRLQLSLRRLSRVSWTMTIVVAALLVIGVLFVYSSCFVSVDQPVRTLYKRQIAWAVIGMGFYFGLAAFDYRRLAKVAWWGYWGAMALLLLVLLVGTRIYGASRWLMLFGVTLQPSEVAKLGTIIVFASILSRPGAEFGRLKSFLGLLAVVAVPFALILRQPDLGTAMVFLPVVFVMMFVAGVPLRNLVALVIVMLLVACLVLGVLFLPQKAGVSESGQERIMRVVGLSPYHRDRITVFLHPDRDPLGVGWNKRQSEIAVGSGGAWGKGFLNGTQNVLGFLPRSVAPTDFIYSVIAEEKGFAGSVVVLLLFGCLMFFGLVPALMTRDRFGRLLCTGVVTLIFCHVFINIAMTVGLMPITGLPLPLLSYGGTFMIVIMSSLGIIQSVYIRSRRVELF